VSQIVGPYFTQWSRQIAHASQFASSGPGAFASGPGTLFPWSMPIAQAARYYWAVKQWRVQWDLEIPDEDFGTTLDTGLIPYPCGFSGGAAVAQNSFPGHSGLVTPSFSDRFLGLQASGISYLAGSNLGVIAHFDDGDYQPGPFLDARVQIFGKAGVPNDPPTLTTLQTALTGMVWDDSTPGNVWVLFGFFFPYAAPGLFGAQGLPTATMLTPTTPAGANIGTVTLDGLSTPLYSNFFTTGTVTITTQDT
jgi:hypothetical protein